MITCKQMEARKKKNCCIVINQILGEQLKGPQLFKADQRQPFPRSNRDDAIFSTWTV